MILVHTADNQNAKEFCYKYYRTSKSQPLYSVGVLFNPKLNFKVKHVFTSNDGRQILLNVEIYNKIISLAKYMLQMRKNRGAAFSQI